MVAQRNDGIEKYPAMTNGTDADFLQVLLGEVREDPLVDLLSRNATSYSSRPMLRSQTTMSMTAPTIGVPTSSVGEARVSRAASDVHELRKAR
jgi:hypothetical protein